MKFSAILVVALTSAVASASNLRQPIYGNNANSASANRVNNNAQFATSADATKPGRAPGYRNAWDDCGGVGASATERMRTIAAKIKGWAKPLPFVRHAAQDCGSVDAAGTVPGPGESVVYPGPETLEAQRAGLEKAKATLEKYPAQTS